MCVSIVCRSICLLVCLFVPSFVHFLKIISSSFSFSVSFLGVFRSLRIHFVPLYYYFFLYSNRIIENILQGNAHQVTQLTQEGIRETDPLKKEKKREMEQAQLITMDSGNRHDNCHAN